VGGGAGSDGWAHLGLGGDAVDRLRDDALPFGVDTIVLRIAWAAPAAPQGYNGRMWRMRPLGRGLPQRLEFLPGDLGNSSAASSGDAPYQEAARDPRVDRIARELGMDRTDMRAAIHSLKKAAGLGAADDILINPVTGDVTSKGESIGNIFDE